MDITELILRDHDEQRRLFAALDDIADADGHSLSVMWRRIATFLETHAAAEERMFYPVLLQKGHGAGDKPSAAAETTDAIKDHNEIRDSISKVPAPESSISSWRSAVAQVRKANSDHMAEEEREALPDFRRHVDLGLRSELGVRFAAFEAAHLEGIEDHDKDPESYIRVHEKQGSAP